VGCADIGYDAGHEIPSVAARAIASELTGRKPEKKGVKRRA
jgi:hypothetical protein